MDLGYDHSVTGIIILDAGPAHLAWQRGELIRREHIADGMNVVIKFLPPGTRV